MTSRNKNIEWNPGYIQLQYKLEKVRFVENIHAICDPGWSNTCGTNSIQVL